MSLEKQKNLMYLQSFSYMVSGASYYTRRSNYPSFLLLYTYEGSGELVYRGESYTLRKGDGFLIDCREEHFYKTVGNNWRHSDLHFWGGQSEFFYQENFANEPPVFHCAKEDAFQIQLEKMLRMQNTSVVNRDFHFSFELERLLQAQMLLQSTAIPCYKVGIMVGFPNEVNFIQHFKKAFAMTPGEYRNEMRE